MPCAKIMNISFLPLGHIYNNFINQLIELCDQSVIELNTYPNFSFGEYYITTNKNTGDVKIKKYINDAQFILISFLEEGVYLNLYTLNYFCYNHSFKETRGNAFWYPVLQQIYQQLQKHIRNNKKESIEL